MLDIEVRRDDLRDVRVVEAPDPEPADGEVVLAVERFGFTANNITYAALGDALRYWEFFPREESWGQIPVWGFGEVVASNSDQLDVGARLFGYFPMSSHMVLTPGQVSPTGLTEASLHRSSLPPAYNAYRRLDGLDPATEERMALLSPLFYLGFLLDDQLAAADDHGADVVLVSSASSKSSIATAFQLAQRGVQVVGLTSARNVEFVAGLDPYARVVSYDALSSLPSVRSVYLDLSGDALLRRRVHERCGDALVQSIAVGATHWEDMQDDGELPGPTPSFFFAPDRLAERAKDWGRAALDQRVLTAFASFAPWCAGWLTVERAEGGDAAKAAYLEVLEGRVAPDTAHVLKL